MYSDAIHILSDQAVAKLDAQRRSLVSHFVRSMLAGMYVGAAIVLIFIVGAYMSVGAPSAVKLTMGVCFGGALTIVIFAGSELFTGSNLVLTLGVFKRRARVIDLANNWIWTWIGNLAGSILLAFMVVQSGVLSADPVKNFILKLVDTKMHISPDQLFWRAILANWLVCLGVWMAARTKEDIAKILLIWWCMFTFISCGYEHSIANMCGLMLGIMLPHGDTITWGGYWYNLSLATLGNIIGGAVFVGTMYWIGSPKARDARQPIDLAPAFDATNGAPLTPTQEPAFAGSK